jgi:Reverse transcriptase (RNA-dependent DNA polymerase)
LENCLGFFNFGENFIKIIKLLCTNREATIILTKDKLRKSFVLERVNAQGDTISPFLFNIGYQILLLKINNDLQIDSFIDVPVVPPGLPAIPATVSRLPRRVFAFADDCNVLTLLNKKIWTG